MALVSVIIPAYHRESELARAVESVRAQTYRGLQIIIIAKKSSDYARAMAWGLVDPRICVFRMNIETTPAGMRNAGRLFAWGKYIAFLDSNNSWHETKIADQLAAFTSAKPSVKAVACDYKITHKNGWEEIMRADPSDERILQLGAEVANVNNGLLIDRAAANAVGPFNANMAVLEDTEWLLRFVQTWRNGITKVSNVLASCNPEPFYFRQERLDAARIIEQQAEGIREKCAPYSHGYFRAQNYWQYARAYTVRWERGERTLPLWAMALSLSHDYQPAWHSIKRAEQHVRFTVQEAKLALNLRWELVKQDFKNAKLAFNLWCEHAGHDLKGGVMQMMREAKAALTLPEIKIPKVRVVVRVSLPKSAPALPPLPIPRNPSRAFLSIHPDQYLHATPQPEG